MMCKSASADAAKFGAQYREGLIEQLKNEPKDDVDIVKEEFKVRPSAWHHQLGLET